MGMTIHKGHRVLYNARACSPYHSMMCKFCGGAMAMGLPPWANG
jgi:hypothetical protein